MDLLSVLFDSAFIADLVLTVYGGNLSWCSISELWKYISLMYIRPLVWLTTAKSLPLFLFFIFKNNDFLKFVPQRFGSCPKKHEENCLSILPFTGQIWRRIILRNGQNPYPIKSGKSWELESCHSGCFAWGIKSFQIITLRYYKPLNHD